MSTLLGSPAPNQPEPYAGTPADAPDVTDATDVTGTTTPDAIPQQQELDRPAEPARSEPPVPPVPPAPPQEQHPDQPPAPTAPVAVPTTQPTAQTTTQPTDTDADTDPDADPQRPLTRVRISHGDLRFARHHVLVGHYPGSTLVGGEGALDELLDGRLSRAAVLGIYPGPIETCQVFTDPEQWTRPPGAVVAGLGPIGALSAASLARAVAHAALTAALGHLTGGASATSPQVLQLCLSSLLIGTGQGGLPVRDSVQALLTGVQRANDRLADSELGVHIAELEVIELWQDRALQAVEALRSSLSSGELADSFTADLRLEERPGRQRRLLFSEPSGWWQQVRVRSEPDGGLSFEASTRRAGTPTRTVPTQRALVDRLVESLVDSPSPDPSAARTLFELLFPNDLKAQAPDTDNLVLLVDRGSAHYPWELLDDQGTQEDREPLGVRRGLVRQLEGSSMRSHVLSATSSRALVVGDTASGLSALPAAQREARAVAAALSANGFEAEPLIAESGTKVVQALFSTSYRVVHLAGHGVYEWPLGDGTDATVTGMVLGNGMYLTAGEVGQMRQVPELVVVNCCHLGSMGPVNPVSPLGLTGQAGASSAGAGAGVVGGSGGQPGQGVSAAPLQRGGSYHRLAASFATELIDIGVRAVVACGWAVDDAAASTFATTFYDRMLAGMTFGESLAAARWETWNDHPSVNTWGAYQCYGDPDYRLAPDAVVHRASTTRRPPASAEQARVEIENLSQSVEVSRNTRFGLDRLRELYEALTPEDREDDALQVLIARTYNKFGDFARATEYFEQTLQRGGTALTVRDFEVWIDQVVRAAAASENAVDDAVATIESAIDRLRSLLDNPASLVLGAPAPERVAVLPGDGHPAAGAVGIDRLWRVASAYKRLALVTCPERPGGSGTGWSQTHEALVQMSQWYAAAREASGASDRRRHGALANWLAAELALRWRPAPDRTVLERSEARRLIGDALRAAREEAYLAPTFWTVAVYADLLVLDALWSPRATPDEARQALDLYRRASELGSEEQLRQVRDQVDFLRVMAGTEAHRRADFLRLLHDGLVALDQPGTDPEGGTVTA